MRVVLNLVLALAAALIAALAAAFFLLNTPDTDRAAMIEKYGGPDARFAEGPGGMKVHWRDLGCRECPPLILIHGSSASLHTWLPLADRLGAERRIIVYDQPGHGLTGPHPLDDYSAAGMMQALDAVAAAAGVESFALGGNSMGGWISWRYALRHPERVNALILIDAAGAPLRAGETPPPLNLGFRLMRNPLVRPLIERYTPRSLVKRSLLDTTTVDSIVTEEMVDRYWELLRYPGNRRASAVRALADRELQAADRLSEIAAPTLILWGADDQLIRVSAADTFAERIPGSQKVIFDGVGHLPMEEAPDKTANAIRRFLETLEPRAEDSLALEPAK
jgi:pimeloyl-ACP methyl ester carboxylesterase